jgi:Fe-S cluster assembly scaffold protein SufB
MPGGGLYVLVAYGAQNVLLSGNPDFTYFYKTYKKYTHFSEESVTQTMDGVQELFYDQPVQVRLKIQRVADLVSDMYLLVDLPDIYCKWLDLNDPVVNRNSQLNFNWTRYVGCQLIRQIGFYIGGQKIQEFDGTYMIAKAQAEAVSEAEIHELHVAAGKRASQPAEERIAAAVVKALVEAGAIALPKPAGAAK